MVQVSAGAFMDSASTCLHRSQGHSNLRHKRLGEALRLTCTCKPIWVNSQLSPLGLQLRSSCLEVQVSSSLSTRIAGNELQSLCEEGQLDKALDVLFRMDRQGLVPSVYMYMSVLSVCNKRKALAEAKQVHAHLARHGLEATKPLGEYVLSSLVECGDLEGALQVFQRLPHRTVSSWTAIICGYSRAGKVQEAMVLYDRMQEDGLEPSKYTFVSLVKACGSILDLEQGKRIHAEAVRSGYGSELCVGTCLIEMYAKCGSMVEAENVFRGLSQYDLLSGNVMLAVYVSHGQAKNALQVYEQMLDEGINPDVRTFVGALQACGILAEQEMYGFVHGHRIKVKFLEKMKAVHAKVWSSCYKSNIIICSTLVSVYSKCGSIVDAQEVFDRLPDRDVVTWNAMLAAYAQQGQADEALLLYGEMLEACLSPDVRTFVSVLQACGMFAEKGDLVDRQPSKVAALGRAKEIHAETRRKGFDSHVFLGNTILSTYSKCDSMVNAQYVFDGLSQRNVVTWNAIIAAKVQQGQEERAFELYGQMLNEGFVPTHWTFANLIQACGAVGEKEAHIFVERQRIKANSLEKGKALHFEVWRRGFGSYVFIGNTLVKMYATCGSILDAHKVFDGLPLWNVVSCNAMLAAYTQQGQARKAMELYGQMLEKGVIPDIRTFVAVLQTCGVLAEKEEEGTVDRQFRTFKSLEQGKAIHFQAWKRGYMSDVFIGSALISMYSKCGCILGAQQVFDGLSVRNVVTWNAMLGAYAQNGEAERALELYGQMLEECVQPNSRSFVHALQACGILLENEDVIVDAHVTKVKVLELGKAIHADAWRKGYLSDVFLGNTLVSMYGKGGSISEAQHVFDGLSEPNVVSWTAMLAAYVKQGQGETALRLYEQMLSDGVIPNNWTFVSALQACGLMSEQGGDVGDERWREVKSLQKARAIHAAAWKMGYKSDVFINTALLLVYTECGSIVDAQQVFDALSERDVVSWNAILTTHVQHGQAEQVLHLYEKMLEEGVTPDVRTFVSVLQGCSMLAGNDEDGVDDPSIKLKFAEKGKVIHAEAWKRGYKSNVFICSTLICVYGKSESITAAETVFEGLSERNVVAWNAMLGAQAQQGRAEKALQLYNRMLKEGVSPDEVTFVCILQACSNAGSLEICTEIHCKLVSARIAMTSLLASSLIHAYGRCASMAEAQIVFDGLLEPNVVPWTALIAGYAYEGNFKASLQVYEEMQRQGVEPDGVTFLSLLSVCSHAGLVDKGLEYFESMSTEHGISPALEHYVTMVDLLGRAGYFNRVEELLLTMPMKPNLSMWLCLLGACRKHGQLALARWAFGCAVHLQPRNGAAYSVMASIYAHANLWDKAMEVNELRETAGAWRLPGKTWIVYEQEAHDFVVGDHKHPLQEDLYHMLSKVSAKLEVRGPVLHSTSAQLFIASNIAEEALS